MSNKPLKGSCLCGRLHYEVTPPFLDFIYCHCERCRKASGSAHSANLLVKPDQFRWLKGEKEIRLFVHAEAEDYPRAFCQTCGGPAPRFTRDRIRFLIPAGTLEEDPLVRPTKNIFWTLRAAWYKGVYELETFDERPPTK